jgi:microcompartment protein CcmL/EutN
VIQNAIGGVETSSMAKGYEVADEMLKAANIKLTVARTICPGKYIVLASGDVADVTAAVEAGTILAKEAHVDEFIIPNVHPDVYPAIEGTAVVTETEALGIVETFSVASLIEAADAAAKSAHVKLLEIKLAMAMGGKALVVLTGTVGAVTTAVEAAAMKAGEKGLLSDKVVIPQPRPELIREVL